jgi:protein-tyrosine phosphatase
MDEFRVFFVCTGNRCRSPFAEAAFASLTANLPVSVGSAGTLESSPAPVPVEMRRVARDYGLHLSDHRSRPLSIVDLSGADLVLGFERGHVEGAMAEAGAPFWSTFTLPEMIRLIGQMPVPTETDAVLRGRAMVAEANRMRGGRPRLFRWQEMADPFGGSRREFDRMAATVASLCEMLVAGLFRRKAA